MITGPWNWTLDKKCLSHGFFWRFRSERENKEKEGRLVCKKIVDCYYTFFREKEEKYSREVSLCGLTWKFSAYNLGIIILVVSKVCGGSLPPNTTNPLALLN